MVPQYFPKINGTEILIPIIAYPKNKVKGILYKKKEVLSEVASFRSNAFIFVEQTGIYESDLKPDGESFLEEIYALSPPTLRANL